MTTASKLTLLRVALIPVFMILFLRGCTVAAFVVFVTASVTDFADGYIARHYNQVSDFGKFLDPLADKMLVFAAMLLFIQFGRMPAWAVAIALARELAVSGLRMIAASKGQVIAAAWSGKIKTSCTMVGICAMLILPGHPVLDTAVTWIIAVTTLISGVEYFVKNWETVKP